MHEIGVRPFQCTLDVQMQVIRVVARPSQVLEIKRLTWLARFVHF